MNLPHPHVPHPDWVLLRCEAACLLTMAACAGVGWLLTVGMAPQ